MAPVVKLSRILNKNQLLAHFHTLKNLTMIIRCPQNASVRMDHYETNST